MLHVVSADLTCDNTFRMRSSNNWETSIGKYVWNRHKNNGKTWRYFKRRRDILKSHEGRKTPKVLGNNIIEKSSQTIPFWSVWPWHVVKATVARSIILTYIFAKINCFYSLRTQAIRPAAEENQPWVLKVLRSITGAPPRQLRQDAAEAAPCGDSVHLHGTCWSIYAYIVAFIYCGPLLFGRF